MEFNIHKKKKEKSTLAANYSIRSIKLTLKLGVGAQNKLF